MHYITVNALLDSTGLYDKYREERLEPAVLGLSMGLRTRLNAWLEKYKHEQYLGFRNQRAIVSLDNEGLTIARLVRSEVGDCKVEYLSEATLACTLVQ